MRKYIKEHDRLIFIIPLLLVAIVLGSLFFVLSTSSNIRMYKRTMCSLVSGPYKVTAEYDGTAVKLTHDNQDRLLNLVASANYYSKGWTKPSGDVVHYNFDGDTDWTVDIYEISDEKILFDVQGDKNFRFVIDNNGRFRNYVKIATPDGWEIRNIVMSQKD